MPGRPGFEPWNIRVATDPTGAVVAVANIHVNRDGEPVGAYIDRLATNRTTATSASPRRCSWTPSRWAREHGAVRSELSTDSRTGALTLYEKVGMSVTSIWVNRALDL